MKTTTQLLEELLIHTRVQQDEMKREIAQKFGMETEQVEISGFIESDMNDIDNHFNMFFTNDEDEIFTIYALPTKIEDEYYVTEIG